MKRASILAVVLLAGCATTTDPYTGETHQELTPAGQVIVAVILGAALIGVAAAIGGGDDSPDRVYKTTYSDGTTSKTEVYDR